MNKTVVLEIVKYLVLGIVIFTVLKYLPNQNMSNCDIVLTSVILLLIYLLLESIINILTTKKKEQFNSNTQDKINFCSSVCNNSNLNIEGMASVPKKKHHKKHHKNKKNNVKQTEKSEEQQLESKSSSEISSESTETKESEESTEKLIDVKPIKYKPVKGVDRKGTRYIEGIIQNEDEYSDYNHVPLGDRYDEDSFEYGYSFLPPEKWYPQPPNPPMCVTDKRCPVLPSYTHGAPLDAKEWNESRRVTPPDNIKTKYIKEKLNSGR